MSLHKPQVSLKIYKYEMLQKKFILSCQMFDQQYSYIYSTEYLNRENQLNSSLLSGFSVRPDKVPDMVWSANYFSEENTTSS